MKFGVIIGIEGEPSWQAPGRGGVKGFCISVALHGLTVAFVFLGSAPFTANSTDISVNDAAIPREPKIIWYPLREMKAISPTQRIGTAPVAQGHEKKNLVAIHQLPNAKTGKQAILRPDSEKPIEREIPAPNLIAIQTPPEPVKPQNTFRLPDPPPARSKPTKAALTAPPPATPAPRQLQIDAPAELAALPKVTRKFVAPPASGATAAPKSADATPPAAVAALPVTPQMTIAAPALAAMPKITRRFVAPPVQSPPAPRQRADEENLAAPVQIGGAATVREQNNGALASVLGNGTALRRPRFVLPPSAQPGARGGDAAKPSDGDAPPAPASINAAVLNTAPLDKLLTAIPDGSRPLQMSAAPALGATSSGPAKSTGLQMAGVALSGAATAPALPPPLPKASPGPKRTVYEETRNSIRRSSLSAPLRPSSRIIPQLIESRFHDRIAYSMILLRPQLPLYAADWVLWFAESTPRPGGAVQMRAPQPLRKLAAIGDSPETGLGGRFQFAGTILKNGQLDGVVVLSGSENPNSKAAAIRDVESWQFAPALRDGEAVDVEVVLEIQFQSGISPSGPGTSRH